MTGRWCRTGQREYQRRQAPRRGQPWPAARLEAGGRRRRRRRGVRRRSGRGTAQPPPPANQSIHIISHSVCVVNKEWFFPDPTGSGSDPNYFRHTYYKQSKRSSNQLLFDYLYGFFHFCLDTGPDPRNKKFHIRIQEKVQESQHSMHTLLSE